MSTNIRISSLDYLSVVNTGDFIPIVKSGSGAVLTTYKTPISSINNFMSVSGSSLSSSFSVFSVSSSYLNGIATASLFGTSSWAVSSSHADWSSNTDTSSFSAFSNRSGTSISSSWASSSISSSHSNTSNTASYFDVSTSPISFAATATSASWASSSISASIAQTASFLLNSPGGAGTFVPGMVMTFAMLNPPTGWLVCSGSSVSTVQYPDLNTAIYVGDGLNGTSDYGYRSTDVGGSIRNTAGTYIKLPDLRGRFVRGWNSGSTGPLDTSRGWASNQVDSFASHAHSMPNNNGVNVYQIMISGGNTKGFPGGFYDLGFLPNTNASGGTETRPQNVVLNYFIKY